MSTSQEHVPETTSTTATAASPALEQMRMAAARSPDVMHRAFDSYPWVKDPKFQASLAQELLGQDGIPPAEAALQCRIHRYEERVGIKIDPERYKAYRSAGDLPSVDLVPDIILEQEAIYEPDISKRRYAAVANDPSLRSAATPDRDPRGNKVDESVPSWQRSAPKAALYVDKSNAASFGDSGKEPYPKKFEEIIAFLQTGKEIPGIKKIPDTVIDDPSISITTGRAVPLKPWEKKATSEGQAS